MFKNSVEVKSRYSEDNNRESKLVIENAAINLLAEVVLGNKVFTNLKQLICSYFILFVFTWYYAYSKSLWTYISILDFNNVILSPLIVHCISKF